MPTDPYGFPILEPVEGEEEISWQLPPSDPILSVLDDLQTLANALAVKDSMSPIEPSLARMLMLMGS